MNLVPVAGLTLREPYASLIAVGAKRIETRSWPAPQWAVGQPVAIHAAKRWDDERADDARRCQFALESFGFDPPSGLPAAGWTFAQVLGCVVCVAVVTHCEPDPVKPRTMEAEFGTYGLGRYAWHLGEPMPLSKPVPWVGRQGLWTANKELRAAIAAARYEA